MDRPARESSVASLAFNPQLPLARPAPRTDSHIAVPSCEGPRFQRLLGRIAAGATIEPGFVVAVDADALLDAPDSISMLSARGCAELIVEFGSLGTQGDPRAAQLAELVALAHEYDLRIHGRFTLGFDHDDPRCFERLVDWVETHRIASVELRLWTPEPGSSQTRALARVDRVRHLHLAHWDGAHVVIEPALMTAQTLYRGWVWAQLRLASLRSVWRRRPAGTRASVVHVVRALESTFLPWRSLRRRRSRLLAA